MNRLIDKVSKAYDAYEFHTVYQSVHHFCSVEMSAFYLDIVKDRLYVSEVNARIRKATQTVLYDALVTITKLIAPILPHTAEEVWKFIPEISLISVQLSDFPEADASVYDAVLEKKWEQLVKIRDEVLKALEIARQDKVIGNSLSALVKLYPTTETSQLLKQFDELEQLFIVSAVELHDTDVNVPEDAVKLDHISVKIEQALGEKCERCWVISTQLGEHKAHETLCPRCTEVVVNHHLV